MSTSAYTIDTKLNGIKRAIVELDGSISAEELLQPSATPAYTLFLHQMEQRLWMRSLKNKIVGGVPALKAGDYYSVEYITMNGDLVVRDFYGAPVSGLFPMAYFTQMVATHSVALANATTEQLLDLSTGTETGGEAKARPRKS